MNPVITNNYLREVFWRLGRKAYCMARGEPKNNPQTNGEYRLLSQVIQCHKGKNVLFLDVGANKGDWTVCAHDEARKTNVDLSVIAFEPCTGTRSILKTRVESLSSVRVSALALASSEGKANFYFSTPCAGTNSLSAVSGHNSEPVTVTTLDAFIEKASIDHLGMVKIDTEGFDFNVLQGAKKLLSAGRIDIIQFEYNWRWLLNHASLRDVFEFIKDKPYLVGKLTGNSIDIYDEWHFEMDRYFENNYVLIKEESPLLNLGVPVRFNSSNCALRVYG